MTVTTPGVAFLIAGMARSGTTLVQRFACELRDVWVPPETHLWSLLLSPGFAATSPLDHHEAARLLDAAAERSGVAFSTFGTDQLLADIDEPVRPWTLFQRLVRTLSPADRHVLGEKTPNHLLAAGPLLREHRELKLVVTIRDPRDIHASLMGVPWGSHDAVRNAWRWRLRYSHANDLIAAFGHDRVLAFRLEDVVVDPDGARRRLADFLGVDHEVEPLPADQHGLFGDTEPWKQQAVAAPDAARPAQWRERLAPDVADSVWRITADVATTWGYAPDGCSLPSGPVSAEEGSVAMGELRLHTLALHRPRDWFR